MFQKYMSTFECVVCRREFPEIMAHKCERCDRILCQFCKLPENHPCEEDD